MDDAIGNLNGKIGMDTALPQAPVGMDENEWEARLDLAACYRMVAHYGCCLLYTSPSPRD